MSDNGAERLWSMVRDAHEGSRPDKRPIHLSSPTMTDTLFINIILENAVDEKKFIDALSKNTALLTWAASLKDENLAYLIWLQRKTAAM